MHAQLEFSIYAPSHSKCTVDHSCDHSKKSVFMRSLTVNTVKCLYYIFFIIIFTLIKYINFNKINKNFDFYCVYCDFPVIARVPTG
jgi:hypothetical protein